MLPPAAVEIDVDPASWFDLGISYSLALVYYASDIPNDKSDLINFCQGIVNDSPDYQGHDHSWTLPDSWCRSRRVVSEARKRSTDSMSTRHNGGNLQVIEYVAYHTYGISLATTDIAAYRSRLVLGPRDNKGARKPLLNPSTHQGNPRTPIVAL